MKTTMKLLCATLFLVASVLWVPQESWALPGACELRCYYPNTCDDDCVLPSGEESTCFDYFCGSCNRYNCA